MTTTSKAGPRDYVGYVRVSQVKDRDSDENRARFHSPDMQLTRIQQSIANADGRYVDYKYDPDRSGYQKHVVREGWNEAVAWVMQDPMNRGIVAYDTSRLSRNLWKLLGDVQHTLVPAGARVIVAGEGVDTANVNWQIALQMAGIMAEQFSIKMGERWDEVHKRRIENKQSPLGKVPYGYRRTKDGEGVEPHPETSQTLLRMYRMYLDGEGLRGICQTLNREAEEYEALLAESFPCEGPADADQKPFDPASLRSPKGGAWSTTSLARVLRNPAAVGRFTFNTVLSKGENPVLDLADTRLREGGWEPILDTATWTEFRRMNEKRATSPNRKRSGGWVLSGIAKCAGCGANLTVNYLPIDVEPGDEDVQVPVPKAHAKRLGLGDAEGNGATWSLAESKHYKNSVSTAMCTTYRSVGSPGSKQAEDSAASAKKNGHEPRQPCSGVFIVRTSLESQFTFFLATLQDEVAAATTGKAAEAREDARKAAAARVAAARADLESASEARTNLAVMRADGTLDEAQFRDALRRVDARADEARAALAQAETDHAAAEPLADAWEQIASGGEGMTQAAWNSVLRRVVSRVEVSDETLLFVPTVGEPVEWERQSLPRGRAARRANAAAVVPLRTL